MHVIFTAIIGYVPRTIFYSITILSTKVGQVTKTIILAILCICTIKTS